MTTGLSSALKRKARDRRGRMNPCIRDRIFQFCEVPATVLGAGTSSVAQNLVGNRLINRKLQFSLQ